MKYTCAMCSGEFESGWTEEEAIAELKRDFGSVPLEECDQVCDDCYQQISPRNNPEAHADYIAVTSKKRIQFNTPLPSITELEDAETIRTYVEAELSRRLGEWFDREFAEEFLGAN